MALTKVASTADARCIVSHYERCWLIEEYHKAFIAVRVLGLRQGGISEETQNDSCEKILTPQSGNSCGLSWKENRFRHRRRH